MNRKTTSFVIQLGASITTLLGVYYGTTTATGSLWYIASQALWWAIMVRDKLWGLLPLNIAMAIVLVHNLIKALNG